MTVLGVGRPLGFQKTGGRKKGTPNKATRTVMEKLDAFGCDPLEGLARIAMDLSNPLADRIRCYIELAQYVYPKRRPVEVLDEQSPDINVTTHLDGSDDSAEARDESQS
jgi:hypothetical protein